MTSPPQQKDIRDILDFLILPSEFEICQTIAMEALDRIQDNVQSSRDTVLGEFEKYRDLMERQRHIITHEELKRKIKYLRKDHCQQAGDP
jgi:hypothetical protein